MRLLLAPNAFKGTFGAVAVARIWEAALRDEGHETLSRPLSDGGDGALEVWEERLPAASRIWFVARDPLGEPRRTPVLWSRPTRAGHVETALACGLALIPPARRDPSRATTFGCGQLLAGLLRTGATTVFLGLGGSATVDGGLGLARALGWRFRGSAGEVERPSDLPSLEGMDPPAERPWEEAAVVGLTDVTAPLVGPAGAARVFGPQKLAPGDSSAAATLARLERGLERLARTIERDLGVGVAGMVGGGAAGGLGAGLAAFAGARLESGAAHFLRLAGIPRLLAPGAAAVDGVLSGEGSYDEQSGRGKVTGELSGLCRAAGVPLAIVAGSAGGRAGDVVLTGADLSPAVELLDERALAALAVEAVRRLADRGQPGVAAPPGGV